MSENTRLPLWLRIVAAAGWFAGTLAVHQAGDSLGGFAALVVILLVSLVIEPRIAPYLARRPLASAAVAVFQE